MLKKKTKIISENRQGKKIYYRNSQTTKISKELQARRIFHYFADKKFWTICLLCLQKIRCHVNKWNVYSSLHNFDSLWSRRGFENSQPHFFYEWFDKKEYAFQKFLSRKPTVFQLNKAPSYWSCRNVNFTHRLLPIFDQHSGRHEFTFKASWSHVLIIESNLHKMKCCFLFQFISPNKG